MGRTAQGAHVERGSGERGCKAGELRSEGTRMVQVRVRAMERVDATQR